MAHVLFYLAITFNKSIASRVVLSFNSSIVHVSPFVDVFRTESFDGSISIPIPDIAHLRLPVIVKPADSGSSLGVSKVTDISQLAGALDTAFKESNHVLIEQFISGREVTVGVARIKGQIRVLPVTEIIYSQKSVFFDAHSKFQRDTGTQVITPAELGENMKKRIEAGVAELYDKLRLSGLVRIDLILEQPENKIFFLEVNSSPSQTEYSMIMKQLAEAGWSGSNAVEFYKQLFEEVL